MDDSIDKQLAEHLRQTLEGYQTPYQMGAWEQFDRARQPANRRLGAWYRSVAAASMLGGLLLAPLWLNDARLPSPTTSCLVASQPIQPDRASALRKQSSPIPAVLGTAPGESIVTTIDHQTRTSPVLAKPVPDGTSPNSSSHVALLVPTNESKGTELAKKAGAGSSSIVNPSITVTPNASLPKSVVGESGQPPAVPAVSTPTATQTTLVSVATALAMTQTATPDNQRERRRAVTWSVALAPQTAYIPNGRSSFTLGGGVVSDFALSRRFSMSTGLSVAQQTLGFAPPVNQVMTTTGRQLTGTDVRFVLIDLPLNLTYQVGKRKKPLFRVSAGLSSLALLNQQYADTYQTSQIRVTQVIDGNGRPQNVQQTTLIEEIQTRPATSSTEIYWGRLLNLSVGIERPLSRRTVFAVEPYVKYPLGPLAGEILSIRSAGVSLRVGIR